MKVINDSFYLRGMSVNQYTETINDILEKELKDKALLLKLRMKIESILLIWMEAFSDNQECRIRMYKRFGNIYIRFITFGVPVNPLAKNHNADDLNEFDAFFYKIAPDLEENISYTYEQGNNVVEFKIKVKPKLKFVHQILIGAAGGAVLGFLFSCLYDADTMAYIIKTYTSPLMKSLLSLLNASAMIMIFFSLAASVCNIGNFSALSVIGNRSMKIFISCGFLASLVSFAVGMLAFGRMTPDAAVDFTVASQIYSLFIDMIPTNIIQPFINTNAIHIIIISVLVGYCIVNKGEKLCNLKNIINDAAVVSTDVVNVICKSLPVIVFIGLFNIVANGNFVHVVHMWKVFLLELVVTWVLLATEFLYVAKKTGFTLKRLVKDIFPVFVLGATTMATIPCLSLINQVCKEKYNVEDEVKNFTIPFGQNFYRPYECVSVAIYLFYLSQVFNISMSVSSIILLLVSCNILIYSKPLIPMGLMVPFALLLQIGGFPAEAINVVIAVDFISSSIRISAKVTGMTLETLHIAAYDTLKRQPNIVKNP